ncbi:hypothetical protein [Paremcibacter congregatus]|uniref:hypothetical protein n=1 Tax=Paremcibacter congregatus TaxID=2043170 RepID=UPI003A8E688C
MSGATSSRLSWDPVIEISTGDCNETGGYTGRDGGFLGAIYPLNHPAGFNGGSYYLRVTAHF